MANRLWRRLKTWKKVPIERKEGCQVVPRQHHELSREKISPNALKVLYRLHHAGYDAFLVGGGVRDILLNVKTKDYDVVTNALPEEIDQLFRNSRIIGRRFRLVHIFYQGEVIECSTFRANISSDEDETMDPALMPLQSDNIYGTIEEDAWRRDFTINSLYYNIKDFSIIDYTGGLSDLNQGILRILGDPRQRFHEDPVRLLRAIRISAKLGLAMHSDTEEQVCELVELLAHVPSARLFHEFMKLFFSGHAVVTYDQLLRYGYFQVMFSGVVRALNMRKQASDKKLFQLALKATDYRFNHGKSLNPGFLLSVFLWPCFQQQCEQMMKDNDTVYVVFSEAMDVVLAEQQQQLKLPNRMIEMIRSVSHMQYALEKRRPKRLYRLVTQRYFRAAYDLLELRAQAGEVNMALVKWWEKYQKASSSGKRRMEQKLKKTS